jgi:glycosyltransferase involved in cell wall biosynthesis
MTTSFGVTAGDPVAGPESKLRLLSVSVEEVTLGSAARTHVLELAAALKRQGASVEVVAPPDNGPVRRNIAVRLWRIAATMRRAAGQLSEYDILYLRAHPLLWPLARLAKARGLQVIQEVNGREDDIFVTHPWARPLASLLISLQRAQYRDATAIAAVTQGLVEWLGSLPGTTKQIGCVANGVNVDLFSPNLPRHPDSPMTPYAIFFGGFHPWHGIETMLAAARHPAWPQGMKFVLVGDGPEAPFVDATAGASPVSDRIIRFGHRDQQTLAGIISHAMVSLIIIENSHGKAETGLAPLKLFESLACGVPVIVSDQPGMGDLVRKAGCGVIVPERDPAALAHAVAELAADSARVAALGCAAREEALMRCFRDARALELLSMLDRVILMSRKIYGN